MNSPRPNYNSGYKFFEQWGVMVDNGGGVILQASEDAARLRKETDPSLIVVVYDVMKGLWKQPIH